MNDDWECISNYRPLSYPLRSLIRSPDGDKKFLPCKTWLELAMLPGHQLPCSQLFCEQKIGRTPAHQSCILLTKQKYI